MLPTTNLKNAKRANQRLTNYRKRFTLLKGNLPRLVIRFTNRQIIMQLVVYAPYGDRVLKTWLSKQLSGIKKYNTSVTTLLALYKKVEASIKKEYGNEYRFIIDSGLKNNSLKLTTLYDTFKN